MPRLPYLAVFLAALFLLPAPGLGAQEPLPVTVSIAPQKYILERIAGEHIAVSVLVKPGGDPHAYEPTPSQMRAASAAACWFTIGVPFEDVWLPRIRGAAPDMAVISMVKGIRRLPFDDSAGREHDPAYAEPEHAHKGEDPHVWLSPMLVRGMVKNAARDLAALLPEKAPEFRKKARAFADELEALDQELAMRFADFPQERRVFLTFHPSWRYFAHNYLLTELSIEAGGKEPGPKTLKAVADAAKAHGLTTIFVEPQFPEASAKAVAQAIGARLVEADPLQENLVELYKSMADKLVDSFQGTR